MKALIIVSILVGHIWLEAAESVNAVSGTKGLITKASVPKLKQASQKGGLAVSAPVTAIKKPTAPIAKKQAPKPAEPTQKLIPLEPSKKVGKSAAPKASAPVQKAIEPSGDQKPDGVALPAKAEQAQEKDLAKEPSPASSDTQEEKTSDQLEVSIDTVGVEAGGNWLSKRVWYERSQDALQAIANELSNILATRQQYLKARDSLDNTLEEAFIELGFDQGKLTQLLDELLESLKEEQKERGDLSEQERKLRLNIEKQQKDLEQLKLDLESLKNLDDSLDMAVKRVMDQINLAGMYNKEAHSYFDQIPNVHEQRAKALYYKIDTLHKDMLEIKAYLTGKLSDYLKQVESNANMHIAKIKSEIAAIQSKGLDFKKQLRVMEGQDQDIIKQREAEQEESGEPEQEPGFFGRIWDWITGWF